MITRLGVIGCGRWGQKIVRDLLSMGVEVHVFDEDPERAAHHLRTTGLLAPVFDASQRSAADTIEGWVVATPASTHARVLLELAEDSRPVFCEKPLTVDSASARQVASALDGRLWVMHIMRRDPRVQALGELARSGRLGMIHGVRSLRSNWTSPRTDVDPVWTLAPHDITVGIEVLGGIPTPHSASVERLDGRAVSMWAHLGIGEEPWLNFEVSSRDPLRRRELRVHGSEAVAVVTSLEADHLLIASGSAAEPVIDRIAVTGPSALWLELHDFVDHVAGVGPPPKSDAAEGVAVVVAVENLLQQADSVPPTSR
jgi:predicted dehydrogenase